MRTGQVLFLFIVMATLAGTSVIAGADDSEGATLTVGEARTAILDGCIKAGGDERSCTCYVDALQNTLPQQSYERMMILAAYAMAGDDEAGMAYMTRYGLADTDFLPMMVEWQGAVVKSSQQCGL